MKHKLFIVGLILLSFGALLAKTQVKYAGFCFSGNCSDIPVNFPYTDMLAKVDGASQSRMDKLFYDHFSKSSEFGNFELAFGSGQGEKISLAMALNREDVAFEHFGSQTKVIYNMGCTLFILDFAEMAIVQSYPLTVTYIDLLNHKPSAAELSETMFMLYQNKLLKKLEQCAANIFIRSTNSLSMKVANIKFNPEAVVYLTKYSDNLDAYANLVAQNLTETLAFKMNLTVLPYCKDTLTQKMSLSFTDASTQSFSIPKSSYDVDFTVDRFAKQLFKETAAERIDMYGAAGMFKIYDAEFGNVYWENEIKHGESKQVSAGQTLENEFYNYNEVLLALLSEKLPTVLQEDKKLVKGVLKKCANY
ncbi:MAG: hypothetical protein RBQ87_09660 [Candidatus Cloacimonadaceae bacterium]|jgi:hypothetical protein|nr:hypothetical protein [Candidatus Cloacimonadaceae bacterium]